jgi:mannose-1-phosphate guanylyltransferase
MEHTYCVIMAGGRGERFWPLSTDSVPKPFLRLMGEKSLIQATVERLERLVPPDRILVVLGESQVPVAREQLKQLPRGSFITEPEGRDTAPCIGYAAITLFQRDPAAVMVTLPADHYIPDTDLFVRTVSRAVTLARIGDYLVTVGVRPNRPETGYGYVNAEEIFSTDADGTCYRVRKFVEKPDFEKARRYVEEGNYYWNSGMFVWQVASVLDGIKRHMPVLHEGLQALSAAMLSGDDERCRAVYGGFERRSIDYGLMEKADNVLMVPALFRWDDIGTWSSLLRSSAVDADSNYRRGETFCIDTRDCVVYGDGVAIGTIGVSHLVVVASKGSVLVCDADRAQAVREIARSIDREKKPDR